MEIFDLVVRALKESGEYLWDNWDAPRDIRYKGPNDPVTQFDEGAQEIIYGILSPTGDVLGEEGEQVSNGHRRIYHVDPIDGTKQYVVRGGNCSTSIGIEEDGVLVGGGVNWFPQQTMFVAYGGRNWVFRNGGARELGLRYRAGRPTADIRFNDGLAQKVRDAGFANIPVSGSFALTMAKVADGILDVAAFGEEGEGNAYDVAGGVALCQSVGVELYDAFGNPYDFRDPNNGFVIVRPEVKEQFLELEPFMAA